MDDGEVKKVLRKLKSLNHDLKKLREDIYLKLDDLGDNEIISEWSKMLQKYNKRLEAFEECSGNMVKVIERAFNVPSDKSDTRTRIELDREEPHDLEKDFTYKSPYGFRLKGKKYTDLRTWKSVYEKILSILKKKDRELFKKMPESEKLVSSRGNSFFAKNPKNFNKAIKLDKEVFAEVNLSANQLTTRIKKVLQYFSIDSKELQIFLREDRGNNTEALDQ